MYNIEHMNDLLAELTSRLPELEWKISRTCSVFSSQNIPRGLFRTSFDLTGAACIEEIKVDIQALSDQKNELGAYYLADRIKQKINVLVTLCQLESRKKKSEEKISFGVKMLSTRQQWIQTLERDINTLIRQQEAMTKALEQMKPYINAASILSLKKELGEVERRLTLAREALNKATSNKLDFKQVRSGVTCPFTGAGT
jgi:hypothetical protein